MRAFQLAYFCAATWPTFAPPLTQKSIHRFRATDEAGLRSLGKDVVKFSIERLNKKGLMSALKLSKSDLGTLKLIETILASVADMDFAKQHMAPLFGVYDLRGADAHLASSDVETAYARIGVDRSAPYVIQGAVLIESIADTIGIIGNHIRKFQLKENSDPGTEDGA